MSEDKGNSELSEADRHALELMPEGFWFSADDLYGVARARFRCDRLHIKGMLERRVVGEFPRNLRSEYRKVKP